MEVETGVIQLQNQRAPEIASNPQKLGKTRKNPSLVPSSLQNCEKKILNYVKPVYSTLYRPSRLRHLLLVRHSTIITKNGDG